MFTPRTTNRTALTRFPAKRRIGMPVVAGTLAVILAAPLSVSAAQVAAANGNAESNGMYQSVASMDGSFSPDVHQKLDNADKRLLAVRQMASQISDEMSDDAAQKWRDMNADLTAQRRQIGKGVAALASENGKSRDEARTIASEQIDTFVQNIGAAGRFLEKQHRDHGRYESKDVSDVRGDVLPDHLQNEQLRERSRIQSTVKTQTPSYVK